IEASAKLRLIVSNYRPGTEISMDVVRDGKPLTLKAKLGSLTDLTAGLTPGQGNQRGEGSGELVPGVSVQNVTAAIRERYDIPESINGVIVTQLDTESKAAAMGIEEGDVIIAVNKKPVATVAEARQMAKGSGNTVLLKVYRKGDTMLFMVNIGE
ncbi:MAG TPA: PDZ domain-containing protein, partial [Prosthecobacter sp.]|nr:PDZ domain-containing protein [Prosthecobacter sp.]